MQTAIKSPSDPMLPPASNTLQIDSFNGVPYSWRWSIGVTTVNENNSSYKELQAGNDSMSDKEWASWTTQPDDYLLDIAADHLGLTRA